MDGIRNRIDINEPCVSGNICRDAPDILVAADGCEVVEQSAEV